mmetsp:Transcript_17102/g.58992  ORF Transcript_17102/g.58992 Transcript_17102/m.58992 type:complete len:268 (+) Transcript_17102:240-1043(+)
MSAPRSTSARIAGPRFARAASCSGVMCQMFSWLGGAPHLTRARMISTSPALAAAERMHCSLWFRQSTSAPSSMSLSAARVSPACAHQYNSWPGDSKSSLGKGFSRVAGTLRCFCFQVPCGFCVGRFLSSSAWSRFFAIAASSRNAQTYSPAAAAPNASPSMVKGPLSPNRTGVFISKKPFSNQKRICSRWYGPCTAPCGSRKHQCAGSASCSFCRAASFSFCRASRADDAPSPKTSIFPPASLSRNSRSRSLSSCSTSGPSDAVSSG